MLNLTGVERAAGHQLKYLATAHFSQFLGVKMLNVNLVLSGKDQHLVTKQRHWICNKWNELRVFSSRFSGD